MNINGVNNWIPSKLCLYNYKFLDLLTNTIYNINSFNNIIVDTSDYVYMYQGNFQGYYSENTLNYYYEIIDELRLIKGSEPVTGDLLLVLYNDGGFILPKVFRINSVKYSNIYQFELDNFLYYDSLNKKIYYVNEDIIDSTLEFTGVKEFNGYLTGMLEPPSNPDRNYYINLNNNTFNTWYNGLWVRTILGLYKYIFIVNPNIEIIISITNGDDVMSTAYDNITLYPTNLIPNKIIYNNVEIYTDNALPDPSDKIVGDTLFLNNDLHNGSIIEVNSISIGGNPPTNQWVNYNLSPISILNMVDGSQNILYSNINNYSLFKDKTFSGYVINTYPNIDNYNLGDTFLLINNTDVNNGKVYEISLDDYTLTAPFKLRELYSGDCYFVDINTCKNYIINYNGINSLIFDKYESNYFVGNIITENIINYVDGEYYSLNISSSFTINGIEYNYGDVCIFKNDNLYKLLINNEEYEIYNKKDGDYENNNKLNKTYVFTGGINGYYGLNEYKCYNYQSNNLAVQPVTGYKVNSFILSYNNLNIGGNVSIYLKLSSNYKQIKLLNKTIIKDFNGNQYLIEVDSDNLYGIIIDIIKPGIKLDNAIASKYIGDDYVDNNLNLFKSSSRLITQIINIDELSFVEFNPQPPVNSICKSDCIVVIKNNDLKWMFETKNINDNSIIFEYSINGINYDLIYNIKKVKVKEVILNSTKFNGYINFESETDIKNNYVLDNYSSVINLTFNSVVGEIVNGIFIVPYDGLYNISILINYSYNSTVDNLLKSEQDAPNFILQLVNGTQQPYTLVGNILGTGSLQIVNYNLVPNYNYSLLSNGTVKINNILNLNKYDKLAIIYNNIKVQTNLDSINGYINIVKIN